jgi:hypothetical protein
MEIVHLLLESGADVDARGSGGVRHSPRQSDMGMRPL